MYYNRQKYKELKRLYYENYIHGNKSITCTACNGSGYYDTTIRGRVPKCESCEGTGREKQKDIISFESFLKQYKYEQRYHIYD